MMGICSPKCSPECGSVTLEAAVTVQPPEIDRLYLGKQPLTAYRASQASTPILDSLVFLKVS
jgi:hypothetical protein